MANPLVTNLVEAARNEVLSQVGKAVHTSLNTSITQLINHLETAQQPTLKLRIQNAILLYCITHSDFIPTLTQLVADNITSELKKL